ncbi:HK97 gp10 family phage protein [Halobacillus salinarum]|uniref:HK97 gp10 family phage protein n=1 Tax=Halobacillus salinarum TaxID=2932257 RepID=A0ABY4EH88_9BACI|nr:HK97 gp10 family phage protein [Halobacillus salinarum]UOQ43355.1 HK97 gp10 family phage protein [Halobacillus salinarum]
MRAEIDFNELRQLVPKIRRALNTSTSLLGQEVWGNLMEFSPQNHGRLAGSWHLQQQGERLFIVGTSVEYAAVQNDGSDPYMIYPRQAEVLRFVVGGQVIYAKEVMHPGITGTHYIEGSIAKAESRIEEFVYTALSREGLS